MRMDFTAAPLWLRYMVWYGASVWCFVFGLFHCFWAFGWYVGLPGGQARRAFASRAFLLYDCAVVLLSVIGVLVSLPGRGSWDFGRQRGLWLMACMVATVLLILRGLAGLGQVVYEVKFMGRPWKGMVVWDIVFCLGGIMFYVRSRVEVQREKLKSFW